MSYKTLIIIDNSAQLNSYNRELIKATVKCFIENLDEGDKVAIAVTGEKAEYITDYEDSLSTQLKTVEDIEFTEICAPGADVLMDVILRWKESDLASRDIIYIGGRGVAIDSDYSEEELLFEISDKQYPIYSLACAQDDNDAFIKNMGSICRISGGTLVNTEDAKEDAEVDRQLVEKLKEAMRQSREAEAELYSTLDDRESHYEDTEYAGTEDGQEYSDEKTIEELIEEETVVMDENNAGNIIYEMPETDRVSQSIKNMLPPVIIVLCIALFVAIVISIKNLRYKREEEKYRNRYSNNECEQSKKRIPFEDSIKETVCLDKSDNNCDTGTRLLYQAKEGLEITLEDRANPTKYFRACVRDSLVIGRNEKVCDLGITYDDSISSRHCELFMRDNSLYCRDLGSSNGTMINQQKVYQEVKIESGDILRIGRVSFFIQILGDSYE